MPCRRPPRAARVVLPRPLAVAVPETGLVTGSVSQGPDGAGAGPLLAPALVPALLPTAVGLLPFHDVSDADDHRRHRRPQARTAG